MSTEKGRIAAEVAGVFLLALAVFTAISLYTYHPDDPSFNSYVTGKTGVQNSAGLVGAWISDGLAQLIGSVAWFVPVGILYFAIALMRGVKISSAIIFTAGWLLLILSVSSITAVRWATDPVFSSATAGGMTGALVAGKLTMPWLSAAGSYVVFVTLVFVALLLMVRVPFSEALDTAAFAAWKIKGWGIMAAQYILGRTPTLTISLPSLPKLPSLSSLAFWRSAERGAILEKRRKIRERELMADDDDEEDDLEGRPIVEEEPAVVTFDLEKDDLHLPPGRGEVAIVEPLAPTPLQKKKGSKKRPEESFQQEFFSLSDDGDYEYPPLKLLDTGPKVSSRQSRDDLVKSSRILEKKLLDFGIEGRVTQVLPGPVITIFEFEPAPGVKVARIANLADDLAMSLRALSIRILAPIPGKSVVGIEVPNLQRESVFLKEILSSEEFLTSDTLIPLALGRDVAGAPMVADLAAVPHLLIAGSTGSGKSVGINAMICSILYRLTPAEVKFIMIDPKMLELSIYDGIPHLIAPVVTNPKKAANALKWVVGEMERRYQRLSELGVRNIHNYNRLVEANLKDLAKKGIDPEEAKQKALADALETGDGAKDPLVEKLPFIVVVIDELADLMMVSSKEVEDSLARLAQMARAAGIHLIVATQRPSVDVLTGLIKANFPARMSFQVRSRVDSRTIIDSMGAEKLLGRGDMLYLPPGASELLRIQGPFVSDDEIHRVVDFLKGQSEPEYNEAILEAPADGAEGDGDMEDEMDDYYHQAVELVAKTRQASISMIQRRLRIGYNRAARIVEVMEKQGLVGPSDGAKPREVFVRADEDVETTYN